MLLPVIPGIPLLIVGITLLGTFHPWVRPLAARLRLWRRKMKRREALWSDFIRKVWADGSPEEIGIRLDGDERRVRLKETSRVIA
jgi:hypothetical protein